MLKRTLSLCLLGTLSFTAAANAPSEKGLYPVSDAPYTATAPAARQARVQALLRRLGQELAVKE